VAAGGQQLTTAGRGALDPAGLNTTPDEEGIVPEGHSNRAVAY
jgi:hypothetical protein